MAWPKPDRATLQPARGVLGPMHGIFLAGGVLVLAAGAQLYLLSGHTARWFSWTIEPPVTAAFLGASYWAACVLALGSARERTWARARVGVPGVLAFVWLTLVATLLHLPKFHFGDTDVITFVTTWAWVAVYAIEPPVLTAVYVAQLRAPGVVITPSLGRPVVPAWCRAAVGTYAVGLLALGAALFVVPPHVKGIWPWPLTNLTAQMTAAWLVAQGVTLTATALEADWRLVGWAQLAFATQGALAIGVVARYHDSLDWDRPSATIFVIAAAGATALGAHGFAVSRRVTGRHVHR